MNLNAPTFHTYEEASAHMDRLSANRRNAERSTGPRTPEGKARSSQNSFKHGLYAKQLIREGEDPAEFDELRATLRHEHQPVNTTEEILVDELVYHFWRMRRFREMEARAWAPDTVSQSIDNGLLALVTRAVASAERGFFRALTSLTKLQKARGFVPQKAPATDPALQAEKAIEEPIDSAPTPGNDTDPHPPHRLRSARMPRSPREAQTNHRTASPERQATME